LVTDNFSYPLYLIDDPSQSQFLDRLSRLVQYRDRRLLLLWI